MRRYQTLNSSRKELKNRLDEFLDVLCIDPVEIRLTEQKLGLGAYAGKNNQINYLACLLSIYKNIRGFCWTLAWNESSCQEIPRSHRKSSQLGPVPA